MSDPGHPSHPMPTVPSRRSSSAVWIGLIVMMLALCAGGAAAAVSLGGYLESTATDGRSPTVPRTPPGDRLSGAPAPSPVLPAVLLAAPERLGGRAKITDSQHVALMSQVDAQARTEPLVTEVEVGYYGTTDPSKNKVYLYLLGLKRPLTTAEFEATFASILKGLSPDPATEVAATDAGPLGGTARCGQVVILDLPAAACAWAGDAGFGVITWYNRKLSQVKPEFLTLRGEAERKT